MIKGKDDLTNHRIMHLLLVLRLPREPTFLCTLGAIDHN